MSRSQSILEKLRKETGESLFVSFLAVRDKKSDTGYRFYDKEYHDTEKAANKRRRAINDYGHELAGVINNVTGRGIIISHKGKTIARI